MPRESHASSASMRPSIRPCDFCGQRAQHFTNDGSWERAACLMHISRLTQLVDALARDPETERTSVVRYHRRAAKVLREAVGFVADVGTARGLRSAAKLHDASADTFEQGSHLQLAKEAS